MQDTWHVSLTRLLLFWLTLLITPTGHAGDWMQHRQDIMGTRLVIDIQAQNPEQGQACIRAAVAEMMRIDQGMSPWISDSEISRINRDASIQPVAISAELAMLLDKARTLSELSGGAFDITFSSIGHRYDYRRGLRPSEQNIQAALPAIDYRNVQVNKQQVSFSHPGTRIDLGGIAKGYAVDRAIETLLKCGIKNAYVSAGGDSRIAGDRAGRPWIIGIQHPRDDNKLVLRLPLSNSAISTSGDYERFFVVEGERVHHILDPGTGRPADASMGATVIGPDATTTDALSTGLFVLGHEKGLQLIEKMAQYEAIIIDAQGRVGYSSGLQSIGMHQADDKN